MDEKKICKSWTLTLFNYTQADIDFLDNLECNYIIYGKEICPKTKKPHIQGYVTFKNAWRFKALHKLHHMIHWIAAVGRPEANINYCKKDGDFYIRDNRTQGSRNDLKELAANIVHTGLDATILELPHMYLKYHNGMEKLSGRIKCRPRDFAPEVYWLWGKSGTGKTRQVVEKEPDLWISGETLKWWDGYEGQEAVLFDDFREDQCSFVWLLRLLDRYPVTVQTKGGTRQFCSKRIYITCPRTPEKEFAFIMNEEIKQLLRRIKSVTEVTEVGIGNTNYPNLNKMKEEFEYEDIIYECGDFEDFVFDDEKALLVKFSD
ncbi:unnamed protein product [Rotaria socialis]|uniref:ATP-dependent helicase Rep n=1 Tax=Rotaria socialis TaxID=392032 RepID=A0A821XC49_9BILA|nr:unnamed protein product [Rotaria socialis]CAF4939723.1 unnamed protein product [Rotaria socialis]